jgi:hypothetical protein
VSNAILDVVVTAESIEKMRRWGILKRVVSRKKEESDRNGMSSRVKPKAHAIPRPGL